MINQEAATKFHGERVILKLMVETDMNAQESLQTSV